MALRSLCILNVVGLSPNHVGSSTPHLATLARDGVLAPLQGTLPAVTCTAQATMLTGAEPQEHGIVANGWLYRDTMEVRFWQQSNALLQREPLYVTARRRALQRHEGFRCAKLFWWFNQGAAVDLSLTPKPHYGSDGSKVFDVHGDPAEFVTKVKATVGAFPFAAFWGPMAGLPSSRWIADSGALVLADENPDLTLIYLPHLDYDLQRFGPTEDVLARRLPEIDDCVGTVVEAANSRGISVLVVSEYGITAVDHPVYLNRILREEGWLAVRLGPFGEMLDVFSSEAFAVCDHQCAHVYVPVAENVSRIARRVAETPGVAEVYVGKDRGALGLDHARAGEIVALSMRNAWFAYPYWRDDRRAPDFARTVDIHRKPGFDPMELFFDPGIPVPRLRAAWRLAQKRMGWRYRMDVVGLDAALVQGSHGLPPADPGEGAVVIAPTGMLGESPPRMGDLKENILAWIGLGNPGSA